MKNTNIQIDGLKTAVVTGATGGIGYYICLYLLKNGYNILAPCRNMQKGEKIKEKMSKEDGVSDCILGNFMLIEADLESFTSIKKFCEIVISKCKTIDLLINNAGIIAPEFALTEDGFERSLQVNYLAPKYITEKLLPLIKTQIINTVSCTIKFGRKDDFAKKIALLPISRYSDFKMSKEEIKEQKQRYGHLKNYSMSKLLLWEYSQELSKRFEGTLLISEADPGIVNTGIIKMYRWYDSIADILFRPLIKSPQKGANAIINKLVIQ